MIDFKREKKKNISKVQFFLEHRFHPDHSPPSITTTQITYGKQKQDMLHLCMSLEHGERRGSLGAITWRRIYYEP